MVETQTAQTKNSSVKGALEVESENLSWGVVFLSPECAS